MPCLPTTSSLDSPANISVTHHSGTFRYISLATQTIQFNDGIDRAGSELLATQRNYRVYPHGPPRRQIGGHDRYREYQERRQEQ